jgi:hypothetical protein
MSTGFWSVNLKESDHLVGLDLDGRLILKFERGGEGMDWINLARV